MFFLLQGKYELDMVLDIHAHTALTGLFVYGNSYDDVYRSFSKLSLIKSLNRLNLISSLT